MKEKEVLVEVKDLCRYFPAGKKKTVRAVDGVSFQIYKGETLSLVGESGCGKTTTGRTVLGMYPATSGTVTYRGKDISRLNKKEKMQFLKNAQIIFQDPYSALDPRMTIGEIISEGMDVFFHYTKKEKQEKINQLLGQVMLREEFADRFAHELSGGQRQRIGIARALAVEPEFIVCDEPISALDVSIQAQIINLLMRMQEEHGFTYLFISHDLSMVRHISDRVGVMYLGNLVELADTDELYSHALHPYTKGLLASVAEIRPEGEGKSMAEAMEGEIPSPINPPAGCRFCTRCKYASERCRTEMPKLSEIRPGHYAACHLLEREEKR